MENKQILKRRINACRSCGFKVLNPVFSLGELYISNFVDSPEPREIKMSLGLVLCQRCGLLQLKYTVSPEQLYRNYWYFSGVNKTMREALASIALKTTQLVNLKSGDYILDIGSNDSTLLLSYKKRGLNRVGFEPARNLMPYARVGDLKIINDFFKYDLWKKNFGEAKAKIITAIAMFYDLEDPNGFMADVVKCLDKKGVFIIQMSYLPSMLQRNAFDNICVKPDTIILGDNQPIEKMSVGNYAIGKGGNLSKLKDTMQRPYIGNLVQIKPMYLEPIVTTPEHPIRIVKKEYLRYNCGQMKPDGKSCLLDWIPAKEVKRGDWVVVPKLPSEMAIDNLDLTKFNQSQNPRYRRGLLSLPINENTAWLLGIYVAEGHIGGRPNNPYINFTLHKKETRLLEKIISVFKSLGYKTNTIFYKNRESMEIRIVCAALARALPVWVGKEAINKCIPDFIMFAREEIKKAFLRGLFDGDGYIKGNKVHFHTSSKTLALQVQLLVASMGGILGISYVKPYPREIRGGRVKSKDSWQLRGSSKDLAKIFGYQHRGKEIKHAIVKDKYILVPVKKTNQVLYNGIVYNIETEDESYLVSNAIVHNCHEHLGYYSLFSLENLLVGHDLEVFDVELNDVNGGSFRIYIQYKGYRPISFNVRRLRNFEKKLNLLNRKVYQDFTKRVLSLKKKLYNFISKEVKKGKKVYVYGASTKGNTLLQFFNLDYRLIEKAADRNPIKWGKKTVATLIPIISEEEARNEHPDYFLILPWHFLKEFIQRERDFLLSGGKFIVPLPHFKIINRKNLR